MGEKTITEWRIIGVSGETVDGRQISAEELKQMAEQYDPEIYGARINLEHFNFLFPGWGGGYGDVLELKAEPWSKDKTKTALLAKMSVLPNLQDLWDEGEKIYTSMEITAPFADTGKAYLTGLAITNTPASLGTTANFSRAVLAAGVKNSKLSDYRISEKQGETMSRNQNPASAEDQPLTKSEAEGIFSRLLAKFSKSEPEAKPEPKTDDIQAGGADAGMVEELKKEYAAAAELIQKLIEEKEQQSNDFSALRKEFDELKTRLETEAYTGERAPHVGADDKDKAIVGW